MRLIALILLSAHFHILLSQQKVSFLTDDSLRVTSDLYLKNEQLPFILLFHQGESSRGEYNEIANRLLKLDYNCLAVDLRSGYKMNFVINETAQRAKERKKNTSYLFTSKDILASIEFVKKYNSHPVILFGSSFSASLSLIIAVNNPDIKAVIAFSPGEYFRPEFVVKDTIRNLSLPLFIASTGHESKYVDNMIEDIDGQYIYRYKPSKSEGEHGAKALWGESPGSDQCWLELILFFKKLRF